MHKLKAFMTQVLSYYAEQARPLPWRAQENDGTINPYHVLVSELMLQQTQVPRVIPKFHDFLTQFPTPEALAGASLQEVLLAWQGLGYNRRARYLHDIAKIIVSNYSGVFPNSIDELTKLKGIGHNTAAAILTYSYNQRHAFIETNVRSVFIHEFFKDQPKVSDKEIMPLLAACLEQTRDYRQWYWALMDYGTYIKKEYGNNIHKSSHYAKQSPFKGSTRELRSLIIKHLLTTPSRLEDLQKTIKDERLNSAIQGLLNDKLIHKKAGLYSVK